MGTTHDPLEMVLSSYNWILGPPKWMAPIKMDDLGVPLFLETPILRDFNYTRSEI